MKRISVKRIYEPPSKTDGYRMLVDRLWPRGLKKENAALNEWNKDIAPSPALRKWFGHKPERFDEFSHKYFLELNHKEGEIHRLRALAEKTPLCLLYAAKDEIHNHANVLARRLESKRAAS